MPVLIKEDEKSQKYSDTAELDKPSVSSAPVREYLVKRVATKGTEKRVVLDGCAGPAEIILHRYALIGAGDTVIVREGLERRVWLKSQDAKSNIPVSPPLEIERTISFAGEPTSVRVIEPLSASDHQDIEELEAFHYRGLDFTKPDGATKKGVGGRRVILLLQVQLHQRWETAGYIELQMPLLMAKPRHVAFNRPFSHPSGTAWDDWRRGGQGYVNKIVRIARTVVHPEYRGAKLSSCLVQAAQEYAQHRWHIGGHQPLFLEISAEMLRHIDFVSPCGFHYLGETEGNRQRVLADLNSIRRGAKGNSGIMSVQRKYFAAFEEYRNATGETFESLIARVSELLARPDPMLSMTKEEWLALHPVIRSPIPYFMIGLDPISDAYVKEARVARKLPVTGQRQAKVDALELKRIEIRSDYEVPQTQSNRLIMTSFGIAAERLTHRLTGTVDFTAPAGTTTFIAGASGCGKSLLLASLDPAFRSLSVKRSGAIVPQDYKVGWLQPFPSGASLFEHLAEKYGAERTFSALANVGLSEAMLFLKPFDLLSRGQRYRAMLADLMLADDDVWLIDEFCSDLDPLSARIVAGRLRETVRDERRIAFVAAANNGHFIHSLRPNRVVLLRTGRDAAIGTWKEFADGLLQ